jgi:hypothetical protein
MLGVVDLDASLDEMVETTFTDIASQFVLLPRGAAFVTYETFQAAYEQLRINTNGFATLTVDRVWDALRAHAASWLVLRSVLGLSPPEWQELANELGTEIIPSGWARNVDSKCKVDDKYFATDAGRTDLNHRRASIMIRAAVEAITDVASDAPDGLVHRLEKIDTKDGLGSLKYVSQHHVPYSVLLYERYLGRPFASHRDSVSELVGDVMESAIEARLTAARIPFRKTGRAERVPGFEQAPDFFSPDELSPSVIIEAKITGDDGTARDKVARVLRLAAMRDDRLRAGQASFQVVACVDGRGFRVRREDMRQLITATHGKVFTASTLQDLVEWTDLAHLRPRP